jgi:hypothetical protein
VDIHRLLPVCLINLLFFFMFLFLQDKDGNVVYGTDGKPLIHTDGTGFISHDLALKCPKNQFKGTCLRASNIEVCG